jgi:hypothetical protein
MSTENPKKKLTAWIIASAAIVLALVGGVWLFDKLNRASEPRTAVATSCSGFEADAHKLFDKSDAAVLSGTFAAGDHVHLVIDFKGVGHSWELSGALGKKPLVTSSGPFTWFTTTTGTWSGSTVSHGTVDGFARLELDVDVTTAGEGVLTINKTGSMPLFPSPSVARASCEASKEAAPQRGVVSISGDARRAAAQLR